MCNLLRFLFFFMISLAAVGQTVIWSQSEDREHTDRCISIASDNSFSMYSVLYTHSSGQSGYNDTYGYLRKSRRTGHHVWEKKVDPGYYGNIGPAKSDHRGNLYWQIYVWGNAYLNDTALNGWGTSIARFDTNGTFLSADRFFDECFPSWDIDQNGNNYFFGQTNRTLVHFNDDSLQFNSTNPFFLLKSDPDGNIIWFREFVHDQSPGFYGSRVYLKISGNRIYFASSVKGSITVDGVQYDPQDKDVFLGAATLDGDVLWSRSFPRSGNEDIVLLNASDDNQHVLFRVLIGEQNGFDMTFDSRPVYGKNALVMCDGNGNVKWARQVSSAITSAVFTDSTFYATGESLVCAKYDLSGNLLYSKHQTINSYALLVAGGEQVIIGGESYRNNPIGTFLPWHNYYSNHSDYLICRLDFTDYQFAPVARIDTTIPKGYCQGAYSNFFNLCENADSVRWIIPGATPPTGTENQYIMFNSPGQFDITVIAYKNGYTDSLTLAGYFKVTPNPVVTVTGDMTVCRGDTFVLSGPTGPGMTYRWDNGDTTISSKFITTESYHHGYLSVQQNGCWGSATFTLESIRLPVPQVIYSNSQLSVDNYPYPDVTYQWFLNDTGIFSGSATCMIEGNGFYTVQVSDTNGCNMTSLPFEVANTGINETLSRKVELYPNPSSGFVQLIGPIEGNASIYIIDELGCIVKQVSCRQHGSIDLAGLSSGSYQLIIHSASGIVTKKLMIQK